MHLPTFVQHSLNGYLRLLDLTMVFLLRKPFPETKVFYFDTRNADLVANAIKTKYPSVAVG